MAPRTIVSSTSSALLPGVNLPDGLSASGLLHRLLRDAADRYPALRAADLPADPARFRKSYGEALVRFEAARVGSDARTEIAASIADAAHAAFRVVHADGRAEPLPAHLASPGEPLAVERVVLGGRPGLRPRVPYRGALRE